MRRAACGVRRAACGVRRVVCGVWCVVCVMRCVRVCGLICRFECALREMWRCAHQRAHCSPTSLIQYTTFLVACIGSGLLVSLKKQFVPLLTTDPTIYRFKKSSKHTMSWTVMPAHAYTSVVSSNREIEEDKGPKFRRSMAYVSRVTSMVALQSSMLGN